jgi:alanine dehydrogenase
MKIGSILENKNFEKRIAITPEIAKKYISLDLEVFLINNYGLHLGYDDKQYEELGVNIVKDEKELISKSDIIIQLALLSFTPVDSKLNIYNNMSTLPYRTETTTKKNRCPSNCLY